MKRCLIAAFLISSYLPFSAVSALSPTGDDLHTQMVDELKAKYEQKHAFSFVQTAAKGILTNKPHEPGKYLLTLENVNGYMTYFSEQPNRITGLLATQDFIKAWQHGHRRVSLPPHALIESIHVGDQGAAVHVGYIASLNKFKYNPVDDSITYEVKFLGHHVPQDKQLTLGYTTVIINSNQKYLTF